MGASLLVLAKSIYYFPAVFSAKSSINFEKKKNKQTKRWCFHCFVSKHCCSDFQFVLWLAGYSSVKLLHQCYLQIYLPKISFLIEGLVWFHLYFQRFPVWISISNFFLDWLNVYLRVSATSSAFIILDCSISSASKCLSKRGFKYYKITYLVLPLS